MTRNLSGASSKLTERQESSTATLLGDTLTRSPEDRAGSAMTARSAIHGFLSSLKWFEDVPCSKFLDDPKAATLVYFR